MGNVGIGTGDNLDAVLTIQQTSDSDDMVSVLDIAGDSVFYIDSDGYVGIGVSENLQYNLTVSGSIQADSAVFTSIEAESISIGNTFSINSSGNIALGSTDTDVANLYLYDVVTGNSGSIISQKIDLIIDDPNAVAGTSGTSSFVFTDDLQALDINFETGSNNTFGSSSTDPQSATGLAIDFTDFSIETGAESTLVGIDIDMGVTTSTETRYAAIFQNGNVGYQLSLM